MKGNSYQRAAELHNLAGHAHLAAAAHHGKEDHETGSEHSRQAMEHSTKAFLQSLAADRTSAKLTGNTRTSDAPARGFRIARRRGK
jgi:hypothetical protein